MPQLGKCRSCGAALIWLPTEATGRLMPLDAQPATDGNVVIVDGKAVVHGGTIFDAQLPEGPRYKSHFATCEFASKHRKSKQP